MRDQVSDLFSLNPHRHCDWRLQLSKLLAGVDPAASILARDDPIVNRMARVLRGQVVDDECGGMMSPPTARRIPMPVFNDLGPNIPDRPANVAAPSESPALDIRERAQTCRQLILPTREYLETDDIDLIMFLLTATRIDPATVERIARPLRVGFHGGVRTRTLPGLTGKEPRWIDTIRTWLRVMAWPVMYSSGVVKHLLAARGAENRGARR
jgi:hypothetical protein